MPHTKTQIKILESEFAISDMLTLKRRELIAVRVGLTKRQVKMWFQNCRAKLKRHQCRPIAPKIVNNVTAAHAVKNIAAAAATMR